MQLLVPLFSTVLSSRHQSSVKLLTRIIHCAAQSVYKVRRSDKNLSPCVSFLDDLWFQVIDSQSNFVFGLNGNDTFILGSSAVDVVMHIIRVIEMMNAHITIMMYAELHFQRLPHPAQARHLSGRIKSPEQCPRSNHQSIEYLDLEIYCND